MMPHSSEKMIPSDTIRQKAIITTGDLPGVSLQEGSNPQLIISSPHSGRHYPDDFLTSTCRRLDELRQVEDAFMDILLTRHSLDAMLISANFPRCFVDVNRHQDELERHLFENLDDSINVKTSRFTKAGLGVIPSQISRQKPIYSRKLDQPELERRLTYCYYPYHHQLKQMIDAGKTRGTVILLDMHSMPSQIGSGHADIVIGTCHGQSAPSWISGWIEDFFTDKGLKTRMNTPFAGGYITRHYGKPKDDVFAIQIEINRNLYMNENYIQLLPEWHDCADTLAQLINQISQNIHHGHDNHSIIPPGG
ncbi:MAG: N-formylglutamate amidohydrolase [Candidatus Puniceispirillales bacterium]